MSYYNRMSQLRYTLKTINQSQYRDVEIVIVDDFSAADQHLNNLPTEFPGINFKLIDMRARYGTKAWCNPCVPYNEGFRACTGDMIIIQNPECCHMGDVLSYVNNHLTNGTYLSFHTYSCTKEDVEVEEDVIEEVPACTSPEPAIIETVKPEPTTIYEQLKQQALANNDLL